MLKIYVSTASVSELCYMLQYTVIYAWVGSITMIVLELHLSYWPYNKRKKIKSTMLSSHFYNSLLH